MRIDLYLGFTSCRGNCIFCRKGEGLVHFPRPTYMSRPDSYRFFHFSSEGECEDIFHQDFIWVDSINISGNDPLSWAHLASYVERIRRAFPEILLTLRISNTYELPESYVHIFDRFEFSIYAETADIHNTIVGSAQAWSILHQNIQLLGKLKSLHKVFFQTIFLHENIDNMKNILFFIRDVSYPMNPIKIIYPYFMPVADIKSLPKKSEVLKKLITLMGRDFLLNYCFLVNFSIPKKLVWFFRWFSD